MNQADRQKIQQSISLLQSILGGGSSSSTAPTSAIHVPGFHEEVNHFTQLGNKLQPEIRELTHVLVEAIKMMEAIMAYSSNCKKPIGPALEGLQQKFLVISHGIDKASKNPNFNYHCKAIRQLMNAHFWVFVDAPEYVFKGSIESADFNAIKFQKLKNTSHNDWYKSIGKAYRILEDFVKKNFGNGLQFNGAGSGSWDDLIKGGQTPVQQSTHHQVPAQTHHQEAPKPVQKHPKREVQGMNWLVANFNKEKITFNPGEVQMKHGVFVENCTDSVVIIEDKFKSIQMNKSKNMTIVVRSCISGVEIMNCENVQIYIKGLVPNISIDKCQKVRVVLNEQNLGVDIVSSKVSELNVAYEKGDGNESKDHAVSEQLITKWNPASKKFETHVYDKFL